MKSKTKLHRLIPVFLLSFISLTSNSQTLKEVFSDSESPLTYLGIDFSKAKLLAAGNPDDIRNNLYSAINYVVVNEPKKYDIKGAFHKSVVNTDIGPVNEKNQKANINEILSTNSADFNRFKESDITTIVKGLNLPGKQGIGLLFVMEAMRKVDKNADASVWVTLIDMKSKKVLMTERMVSKTSGGIGFRNYWASTIDNTIQTIKKNKYQEWQSKFSSAK